MVTAFELEEAVREARARTGVPGVVAGISTAGKVEVAADGVLALGSDDPVRTDTPFRIASITKSFTAALCFACLEPDERVRALLGHTAGLRCDSCKPLPEKAQGLFSYSNSGYIEAGNAAAAACGTSFDAALAERVLAPLGLDATAFDERPRPARGHVQDGETGHRLVPSDLYRADRHAAGGLWSTAADLLTYGSAQMAASNPAHEPHVEALGAHYAYGWWVRELADGRTAIDHEGSVAGYQSLLLLVPADGFALAVLTNSWRGSGLIRRVVERLGLVPRVGSSTTASGVEGTYVLDSMSAIVERNGAKLIVTERDVDPVTGDESLLRYPVSDVGDGVYAFARGALMSHRLDFPRPGVARIGWAALSAR
ncbi:MAG TPA: serine hydrolase domain-containing protein [Gaiellaceae bacterium]|nr:serine hydrolase domain-containing protein [Gaiellaceae bacterium]